MCERKRVQNVRGYELVSRRGSNLNSIVMVRRVASLGLIGSWVSRASDPMAPNAPRVSSWGYPPFPPEEEGGGCRLIATARVTIRRKHFKRLRNSRESSRPHR